MLTAEVRRFATFRPTARTARCAAVALGCLVLGSSCQQRQQFFPVHGRVLVGGKPAEGALVVFHPVEGADSRPLKPSGVVQADGSFAVQTYDPQLYPTPQVGAPAGEYLITVSWVPANYAEYRNVLPDKLQGRYNDPKTSSLRATVTAGPNELPPFQLESKARPDGGRP